MSKPKKLTSNEDISEHTKAKIALSKIDKVIESQKVSLKINEATTILVHPSKATEEYRQVFIKRMNKSRESYLKMKL